MTTRIRLTSKKFVGSRVLPSQGPRRIRKAAPNEFSGRNPNTPIKIYDTHPNQRFALGEDVMLMDPTDVPVRGTVLGHVAEDRLLVQWPHMVTQEDVDDVIAIRETTWRGMSPEIAAFNGGAERRTAGKLRFYPEARKAGIMDTLNPWSAKNQDAKVKKQILKNHGGDERSAVKNYNLFADPNVQQFLKRYGLSDNEISNFGSLRTQQLNRMYQKTQKFDERINQNGGNVGQMKNPVGWGKGSGFSFNPVQKPTYNQAQTPSRGQGVASKGLGKIHRAANLVDGLMNNPVLAAQLRILPHLAGLTSGKSTRTASALRSLARLAMKLADKIRESRHSHSEMIANLLEDGVVEATPLQG